MQAVKLLKFVLFLKMFLNKTLKPTVRSLQGATARTLAYRLTTDKPTDARILGPINTYTALQVRTLPKKRNSQNKTNKI